MTQDMKHKYEMARLIADIQLKMAKAGANPELIEGATNDIIFACFLAIHDSKQSK